LTGAIGGDQFRKLLLELQQLAVEAVIDRVFHLRSIQYVIRMCRCIEEPAEFGESIYHQSSKQ
jgi:hypothetical protein